MNTEINTEYIVTANIKCPGCGAQFIYQGVKLFATHTTNCQVFNTYRYHKGPVGNIGPC